MGIKYATLPQILECLLALRSNTGIRCFGICASLEQYIDSTFNGAGAGYWLRKNMRAWPKYSGDDAYPVPDPAGKETPRCTFWQGESRGETTEEQTERMWSPDNPYGALRLELLNFLIERADAQIKAGVHAALAT